MRTEISKKRKVIAIVGATASGKTGIGVRLAKEYDGEIVSADSRQVYRGLDIGTGKEGAPNRENSKKQEPRTNQISTSNNQLKNCNLNGGWRLEVDNLACNLRYVDSIPQWMIDIADPEEKMTLFDYLPLARLAIEDILSRGKLPIIVGGTGLYVQGLIEGFELEKNNCHSCESRNLDSGSPASVRNDSYEREQLENNTLEELNIILKKINPEKYEKVDKKNRHRLIRAIELSQEGLNPTKIKPDFEVLQIGLDIPRKELHERIDRRVDERFEQGMLEEVKGLLQDGIDPEWLIGLGLEYKAIANYLLGCHFDSRRGGVEKSHEISRLTFDHAQVARDDRNCNFDSMKQTLKFKIHQFARRQMTWFRRFPEINWLSDYKEISRFARIFLEH